MRLNQQSLPRQKLSHGAPRRHYPRHDAMQNTDSLLNEPDPA